MGSKCTVGGRILCWVPSSSNSLALSRAELIRKTWGRKCDILLFMVSRFNQQQTQSHLSLDEPSNTAVIGLPVKDSYSHLWGKTQEALKYIHDHFLQEADWFFKVDDDS